MPFFDVAYQVHIFYSCTLFIVYHNLPPTDWFVFFQGFASGSLDEDAFSVRLFVKRGMEVFVAQSYSKNLGLYAERVGAINVVCSAPEVADR